MSGGAELTFLPHERARSMHFVPVDAVPYELCGKAADGKASWQATGCFRPNLGAYGVNAGATVTYVGLQLAHWMGCEEVSPLPFSLTVL